MINQFIQIIYYQFQQLPISLLNRLSNYNVAIEIKNKNYNIQKITYMKLIIEKHALIKLFMLYNDYQTIENNI